VLEINQDSCAVLAGQHGATAVAIAGIEQDSINRFACAPCACRSDLR
jgi:hypothetical protein